MLATKGITSATGKAVSAGNSGKQNEAISAANQGRQTVVGLLQTVKATALQAEAPHIRDQAIMAGRECGEAYSAVLAHVLEVRPADHAPLSSPIPLPPPPIYLHSLYSGFDMLSTACIHGLN